MNLLRLQSLVNELNANNSVLAKKSVLKNYPDLKEDLSLIYNPFLQFGVTSANIKKNQKIAVVNFKYKDLSDLLRDLADRKTTGHEAIGNCNRFLFDHQEYAELIYNIIDKDLKTRTGIKIINEVFPDCIPTFTVALANSLKDYKGDVFKEDYYASHKLDGCRLITIIEGRGDIKFFSREGKEFTTLGTLKSEITKLNLDNTVLDGEICILDQNGNEDFQNIVSLIKRKDYTIENPVYLTFDMLTIDEFNSGTSTRKFIERYNNLQTIMSTYTGSNIKVLEQTKVQSQDHLDEMMKEARVKKWEGLILRKNTVYKNDRSNDILKMKDFHQEEYVVKGIETGPFRIIESGKEVTIDTLTAVVISHKDNNVSVGSGFSLEQRKAFYSDPSLIVGKTISVQYFQECSDSKTKQFSLRFPTFKGIIGSGRRDI